MSTVDLTSGSARLTSKQRESCIENVHLELSAWVTSKNAAVVIAGIETSTSPKLESRRGLTW